jgi:dihydrofolate reductase
VQVHGSAGLAQTLIQNDLIDEYRVLTFPVILGKGKRLFGSGTVPRTLKLVRSGATSTGVIISVYRQTSELKTGSIELADGKESVRR